MISIITPDFQEIILRLILLAGMIVHKIVWEVMKSRESLPVPAKKPSRSLFKSLIKMSKTLFLLFLVIQTMFLNVFPISSEPSILRWIGLGIYFNGLLLAILGRVKLGDNWANIEDYQVLPGQRLVQSGVYRYIRHPIYTGDLLLVFGLELALNSWLVLVAIGIAGVTIRQAYQEEAVLTQNLPGYREYQKHTKMFVPFIV